MSGNISYDELDMLITNDVDYEATLEDEVLLNDIMVGSATFRRTNKGVSSEKLSKTWKTDKDYA